MPPQVSPSEWEVLNVLWDLPSATVPEICEALSRKRKWHPKTVGTFLTRLVKKGVLNVHKDGKVNVYSARKTREQCIRAESESFLQRVFQGSFAPMLMHFVEEADLSEEEIRDLQRILKKKKG